MDVYFITLPILMNSLLGSAVHTYIARLIEHDTQVRDHCLFSAEGSISLLHFGFLDFHMFL
jgi:hypothetical protein